MQLKNRVIFITGATRGIGLAIGRRAAKDNAKIVLLGKTVEPHPKLEGTLDTARAEIEALGAEALAVKCDIRSEEEVKAAVDATIERFGAIDVLVNNASAIQLTNTASTELKRFDLMHQVNARGSFMCGKYCLPHLKKSEYGGRILTLSPPLNLKPEYFGPHLAYSMAKFSMSLCTLGWAQEFAGKNVAANSLWPRTVIDSSAVRNLLGGEATARRARTTEMVADAAHAILSAPLDVSGRFFIDDEVLIEQGISDFEKYRAFPGDSKYDAQPLMPDLFVDPDHPTFKK